LIVSRQLAAESTIVKLYRFGLAIADNCEYFCSHD